jgi:hypothetical protein
MCQAVREKYFMRNAKFLLCMRSARTGGGAGKVFLCVMPNLYCVCAVPELVAVREKYFMRNAKFVLCICSARTGGGAGKVLYA